MTKWTGRRAKTQTFRRKQCLWCSSRNAFKCRLRHFLHLREQRNL